MSECVCVCVSECVRACVHACVCRRSSSVLTDLSSLMNQLERFTHDEVLN